MGLIMIAFTMACLIYHIRYPSNYTAIFHQSPLISKSIPMPGYITKMLISSIDLNLMEIHRNPPLIVHGKNMGKTLVSSRL